MNPNPESFLDELTSFVQVIGKDKALRQLFHRLAKLSPTERSNEVHLMAEQMTREGKAADLVTVFRTFADERVFKAAIVALRDRGYVS